MLYRQSHKAFFEKSDLFFVCILRPLSFDIQTQELEIEAAAVYHIEKSYLYIYCLILLVQNIFINILYALFWLVICLLAVDAIGGVWNSRVRPKPRDDETHHRNIQSQSWWSLYRVFSSAYGIWFFWSEGQLVHEWKGHEETVKMLLKIFG